MKRTFVVECEPRGQGRPRFNWTTRTAYKAKEDSAYEAMLANAYEEAYPDAEPIEGPFAACIDVYFGIPKSFTKAQKKAALAGVLLPTKRLDLDNAVKSVLDSGNGIIYTDDKNCVSIVAHKYYSETPHLNISIEGLELDGANSPK